MYYFIKKQKNKKAEKSETKKKTKKQTFFVDWFAFVHFDQVSSSYYKIPVLLVKKTLYIYARLLPPIFF